MSCEHGNHVDACDLCEALDEAYERGRRQALEEAAQAILTPHTYGDTVGCWFTILADKVRKL